MSILTRGFIVCPRNISLWAFVFNSYCYGWVSKTGSKLVPVPDWSVLKY